jgi:hypothetical protein
MLATRGVLCYRDGRRGDTLFAALPVAPVVPAPTVAVALPVARRKTLRGDPPPVAAELGLRYTGAAAEAAADAAVCRRATDPLAALAEALEGARKEGVVK